MVTDSGGGTRRYLVDSNILLDIASEDQEWQGWSTEALAQAMRRGTVAINPLIYSEVSVGYDRIEALDDALPQHLYMRLPLPYEAGFLAGKAFAQYKARGGGKSAPLPDFFIGAHAAISGLTLITRDAARCRTYFPTVDLVTPRGRDR